MVFHLPETAEEKRRRILSLAREAVAKAYSTGEHSLAQAINAYNEIEKSRNLLHERLGDWYGIYFPELDIGSQEAYARFVMEAGRDKRKAGMDVLEKISKDRAGDIMRKIQDSIGNEPSEAEYEVMRSIAGTELELIALERDIDAFLKESVPKAMPNVSYLIDYKLAAELLAKAGSLSKLAEMPASTIQLLGAEKALFRHLRSGSKPPKYGILFRLKEVASADRRNRGKIARVFATKISIAARADAISKRFIGEVLKESLDKSIARINSAPLGERKPEQYVQYARPRQEWRPRLERRAQYPAQADRRQDRQQRENAHAYPKAGAPQQYKKYPREGFGQIRPRTDWQRRDSRSYQQGAFRQRSEHASGFRKSYEDRRRSAGFQQRQYPDREGGFQQRRPYQNREGGFPRRPYPREGGFQQRPYQNRESRGFPRRPYQSREGGFRRDAGAKARFQGKKKRRQK